MGADIPALRPERIRAVDIDRDVLRAGSDALVAKRGSPTIRVSFFDDAVMQIEVTASERTHNGGMALVGRVTGDPHSSAVLVDNNGVVSISVASGALKLRIEGTPETGYVAKQMPAIGYIPPAHHDSRPVPASIPGVKVDAAVKTKAAGMPAVQSQTRLDDGSLIDVMIMYTPAARSAAGGAAQMEANIDEQVAYTNLIYQNSGVVQRLRLVHKAELAWTEGDVFQDLGRFVYYNSAIAGQIKILRDAYAADLVSIWGVYPQVCGVAYYAWTESLDNEYFGYGIINAPTCTGPGQSTFAHELGHNMGLDHERPTPTAFSRVTPEGSTVLADATYSFAYTDPVNRFTTVMGTGAPCYTAGFTCIRAPYFSNPALTYDNRSFHPPAAAAALLGDAQSAHEARALNDTRETIANYRVSVDGPQLKMLTFLQRVARVNEDSGTVTLTVHRLGPPTGAASVDYATANGTALAGTEYTTSTGTLTWADGDASPKAFTVPILLDAVPEAIKSFNVQLSNASAGSYSGTPLGSGASIRVDIVDYEPDPYPPGGVMPSGFTTPGESSLPWQVDTSNGDRSRNSLGSGRPLSGSSDLVYTGNFGSGNLTFTRMLSSPPVNSKLELLIDGVVSYTQAGGEVEWATVSVPISAGNHTLIWRYTNTETDPCFCENRAWIDDVVFPPVVVVNAASHLAFVANSGSNSVSVIELVGNTVIATIPVGIQPIGVAAHPDGTRVYMTNAGSSSVSVIDAVKHTVIKTLTVGNTPYGIVVNAAGTRAYVAQRNVGSLGVIDTTTDTVLPGITMGGSGYGIDLNAAGTRAYVGINNGSAMETIDLVNQVSLGQTSTSNRSTGVAVQADGTRVWVAQNQAGNVNFLNAASGERINWVTIGGQPVGVAAHPTNKRIYVATGAPAVSGGGNTVAVIDATDTSGPFSVQPVSHVTVGSAPFGIALHPEGTHAYVANYLSNNVSVVNLVSNTVVATVPVGTNPFALGKFVASVKRAGAPRNVVAMPGNGTVTLVFDAPAFDGGSPITQYAGTCMPGTHTASGSASPLVFTGLTNGTAYSCTVTATTARGVGAESAPASTTPITGTQIVSANAASFPVLSAGSFTVQTQGAPVTSFSVSGTLPAGVTLSSGGVLAGTPASGTAGEYSLVITANNNAPPAGTQNFTLTVTKIAQTITFAGLTGRSQSNPPFTVNATGGASGNAVIFSSNTTGVCTTGGSNGSTVTLVGAGTCTIAANQAGNADYLAAPQVTQSFSVRGSQTIVVGTVPAVTVSANTNLPVTGGESGQAVIFTSDTPDICTMTGNTTVRGVSVGACRLFGNQAGNASYDPASQITLEFNVGKGAQAITWSTEPLPVGIPSQRITGQGGSGNFVFMTSLTPGICTVDAMIITALEFGICKLRANQAGNANYLEAPEAEISITTFSRMSAKRFGHVAVRLPDGRVLVAGGQHYGIPPDSPMLLSAEVFDPVTVQWTATANMTQERFAAAAVVLNDGRILVSGGMNGLNQTVGLAEMYDPATGTWSPAGNMVADRHSHRAVRLPDGRVLVMGGYRSTVGAFPVAEIYNPTTNAWAQVPATAYQRGDSDVALLQNGKVLIAGGIIFPNSAKGIVELYDPVANSSTVMAPTIVFDSNNQNPSTARMVVLNDGSVLVLASGFSRFARYFPATNTWSNGATPTAISDGYTATLLSDGRVVVAGGAGGLQKRTMVYDPVSNMWATTRDLVFDHNLHSATLLADGRVLIAGGNGTSAINTHQNSEIFRAGMEIADFTLEDARVGEYYGPISLSAMGGVPPISFAVTDGALPGGITLSTGGVLSGIPSATGTFNFTLTATDAGANTAARTATLTVTLPSVIVTPSAGPNGSISPSTPQVTASGATRTFTVTANTGYTPAVGGTCGGTLTGNSYTTSALTTACTVVANFNQVWFPPDPPVIGTPVPGPLSAIVHFTPPANNGGAAITSYTARCAPSTLTGGEASGTSSPITVSGLNFNAETRCTVTANNVMGAGASSAPTVVFRPTQGSATLTASRAGSGANIAGNTITGGGINCPGVCSESRLSSSTVTLTANTGAGAYFSGWIGSGLNCQSKRNDLPTCAFEMGVSNRTVTAVYLTTPTVPQAPPNTGGRALVNAIEVDFYTGLGGGSPIALFTATCTPTAGGAGISATGGATPIVVTGLTAGVAYTCRVSATNAVGTSGTLGQTQSVVPLADTYLLTVNKTGAGRGTVTSNLTGIVCGEDCSESYSAGTNVTLTASATEGSTFAGWGGGTGSAASCSGTATCVITLNEASSITATFAPPSFTVTPSAGVNGAISPPTPQTVALGSTTSFTVTPSQGYSATVGGSCGGTLTGSVFTTSPVAANCTVVASFVAATMSTLTVNKTGTGSGTISSTPAGIDCGADCSESIATGTAVTLTAAPASGSTFVSWSGVSCTGGNSTSTCSFTLSANTTVTAAFDSSLAVPNDFNDDARSDLLWRNGADGSVQGWLMDGLSATQVAGLLPAGGYTVTHVADLDGNGKVDTLIRHADGTTIGWLHDGLSVVGQTTFFAGGSGWSIQHTADLNGDGKADLIVEHTDGRVVGWLMNGLTVMSTATFVPAGTGWTVSRTGDLNGDGKADLIWQNANGTVQAWLMDGLNVSQTATFAGAGSGWSVKLVADFNGDGKGDLVWQNTDGTVQAWLMDGTAITQIASFVPAGTGWSPVLAGDIDGDGKADLFWEHTDGRSQTWLMNGLTVTNLAGFVGAGGWKATHLLDLNGDSKKDVLWRHNDGTVQAWLLSGLNISQISSLAGAGTYEVIPPRQ